jgi:hypothetical protein
MSSKPIKTGVSLFQDTPANSKFETNLLVRASSHR